jgi:serine/threonine protein kinase/Tfp pilus assembly protein PilF
MADEKWQQVREVFDSALRRKPEERRKFVIETCGEDKLLLTEVESLLSSLDSAEGFMETPAVAKVADVIEVETKKLESGKCFGHYEIVRQIGTGGMGEVYLAEDKKLDRKVALKILNEKFSRDGSNLNRFIQEAKAASALNHPNILTIYEFGEAEDAQFIVSEFIKGKTLREIFKEKTLKLSEVLDISVQITNALCTAHEAHLVHRDIKPENIMIRPDGYVKVLDFGLAKLIEQKNKSILGLEDSTVKQNQTAKGVILGTINYMSPEQAKGERVDERTDIFSFGVVIYEMMAGRTPFAGDSVSETFANLINAEPQPLSRFASNVPDELQRIVAKMIRKNKGERYQMMKDVLADLKDLRENLSFDEKLERSHQPVSENETAVLQATTGGANLQTAETQYSLSQTIKRHKPLAAFALVALLVGVIGLGYYFFSTGKTAVGDKKSIAVLPSKPINTMNRGEIYEVGIADSLINQLSSMKGFIVRPLSATRQYADIAQDPIAAGREQQVDYVLASNYQLAGGKIKVTSQLFNVANGQIEETYKSELVGVIGLGYYFFSTGKTAVGDKKSIAVLPSKPINTMNRGEIYEVGIADSLINQLSSMKGFIVRPLSATRQYADIAQDPIAAGREQQVDYVLASNYQLAGGKIKVTSQLFNVANGQIEETYKSEKDAGDVFAMQDAVADEIGRLLLARFATTSTGPAAKRGTTNEEAYRFYLQGMFLLDRSTAKQKAVEALEQSVRLDPNYAQGWAGLAVAHGLIAYSVNADLGEEYQKSVEAINKALSLDPDVSEAYTALCEIKYQYEWDFAGAGRACQRALELNHNSSLAHNNYARFLISYQQRHDEAIAEIKTAIDLDPTSFHNQRVYANTLYFSRRYDEAVAQYKRLMQMNEENDPTYQWLIRTLEMQGKEAEAFEWLMKSPSMQKKDEATIQLFKTVYQTSGWAGVLRERDKTSGEGNFFRRAGWNARLGDKDKAFEYLEKAYQQRNPLLYLLQVEPPLDPLRDDPRFDELVKRVGLK